MRLVRTLSVISPLDGRYASKTLPLAKYFSEEGLMRYRVKVELHWLKHLCQAKVLHEKAELLPFIDKLTEVSQQDLLEIKQIQAKINHDVKAVQLFIKGKLQSHFPEATQNIHLCFTSEDVNNLAYALLLTDALTLVIKPQYNLLYQQIKALATQQSDSVMLSRTHGQSASPTTMGKQIANFGYRLNKQMKELNQIKLRGKCSGAVGNFNAHYFAYPEVDWRGLSKNFVENLGLQFNPYTTQIQSHDSFVRVCNEIALANTILLGMSRDLWHYTSLGYFRLKVNKDQVGSSTMPHKVNPIDFQNAQGNFGVANSLFNHFAAKLPISRLQRDLSDSTVLRTQGTAFGHSFLAVQSLRKGLSKIDCNKALMREELDQHLQVVTQAIQTLLRRKRVPKAYEILKQVSRGSKFDKQSLQQLITRVRQWLTEEQVQRLRALKPSDYLGQARQLASQLHKNQD